MRKLKIEIDRTLCIGAAVCTGVAPGVFEIDAEQKAVVKDPTAADEATILEAAEGCPTKAIIVVDEETGEQLYP